MSSEADEKAKQWRARHSAAFQSGKREQATWHLKSLRLASELFWSCCSWWPWFSHLVGVVNLKKTKTTTRIQVFIYVLSLFAWGGHTIAWRKAAASWFFCLTPLFLNVVWSRLLESLFQLRSCSSSPTLPGPPNLLFIGNMMELTHDHLPIHLTNLARRYGNIYRLKCGNTSNDACLHSKYRHFAEVETPLQIALLYFFSNGDTEQHWRHKRSVGEKMVRLCWETGFIHRYDDLFHQDLVVYARKLTFHIAACDSSAGVVSAGGRTISLGDYTDEWRAHRRLVHSALQHCCQQSLHDVIERQAHHLKKVQKKITLNVPCSDFSSHSVIPNLL